MPSRGQTSPSRGQTSPLIRDKVKVKGTNDSLDMKLYDNKLKESVGEIDSKITHLRYLFKHEDPLKERLIAAIKIEAIIRGWLVRLRLQAFRRGLVDWRWTRCRPVVWILESLLGDQLDLEQGIYIVSLS